MSNHINEQGTPKRAALIVLHKDDLAPLLGLPAESSINYLFQDMGSGEVWIIVESPDLPEIPPGKNIPTCNPSIITTFDWGIK